MNPAPTPASLALRRLLIVVAVAAGLVVFAYGWTVTEINFDKPQETLRQTNFGNALRELLSPNLLERDYDIKVATTPFLMQCRAGEDAPAAPATPTDGTPYITVTPTCASSGDPVTIQGYNFFPDALTRLTWVQEDGTRSTQQIVGNNKDNFVTGSDGTFNVQVLVPRIRGTTGETHTVEVQGLFPAGAPRLTATAGLVLEKMIETIFLALIATVISILPSVVISMFAAHNLMRSVRMSLGNLLVMVALIPVGWWLGSLLLSQVGLFVLGITSGGNVATIGTASLLAVGMVASSPSTLQSANPFSGRLRSVVNTLIFMLLFAAIAGLLGGLGLWIGSFARGANITDFVNVPEASFGQNAGELMRVLPTNILIYLSRFIGSIGQLIALLIVPICGVIGAFGVASIGGTLTIDLLKKLDTTTQHILGAILGAISGAFVLAMMAIIGMQAAWLGLLPPIVAGIMGAQLLPLLSTRVFGKQQATVAGRSLNSILWWVGFILAFVVTFSLLNVSLALIEGTLPPANANTTLAGITLNTYIFEAMLVGAVLGGIGGALVGTRANFSVGEVLYQTTRTILNTLRAIEPLIIALIFSIWVGIGPFAGVLALTLHSIASLAKLYSEQIESIDVGPIEALESTGANRLQTIMYAVVPQVIPPFVSFTMYRWDINVRMSTIIGFVGGGGIGFLLQQQINLLRYRDAGVAVLAIAIVVSVLDYLSAAIREKYV